MKILVIGGVAAGTKAAAKCKRENRADEELGITKSADISYAGCGLPYYVGGSIEDKAELIVNTPQKYQGLTGVEAVSYTHLQRGLVLVLQVLEVTSRVVVCVNLMDEACRKGVRVDLERLSGMLGVPVVGCAARSGKGLPDLLEAVASACLLYTSRCV